MFLARSPRIAAVVLNYNSHRYTRRCLAALRRSSRRDVHLTVVDNDSRPDDLFALRSSLPPGTTLLRSEENLGYAGGNNLGIRHALERDVDFVWILNPDTEVTAGALALMMDAMSERPDVGVVGSLNLVGASDPATIHSAGGEIHWDQGAATVSMQIGRPLSSVRRPRRPYVVDYVAGASMLIRRQVFDEIGLIPEHYFLYYEETDFQVRARRLGWVSVVHPQAHVWHHRMSTGDLPTPYYLYYYIRGRFLFAAAFTQLDHTTIERHLEPFIGGWRTRIEQRAPHWLPEFDRLVSWGLVDGQDGVTGRRADIEFVGRASA